MPRPVRPRCIPDVTLPATLGTPVNVRQRAGLCVLFIYPYTGRPGHSDPQGWDTIPGAHGSTPQALGYKALFRDFEKLKVGVFGMSFQSPEWQLEFSERHQLPFNLLSDNRAAISTRLGLQTFMAGGNAYLTRRTMVIRDGRLLWEREEVPDPAKDASTVLAWVSDWLRQQ
jgi:peroxiredoxin